MKIAIIGVGMTKFGELWNKGLRDLLMEAQLQALEDARISEKEIEAIFTANMCGGEFAGQEHLGAMAAENINSNVPSVRVEGACASGSIAIRLGALAIESGQHKIVMVNGVEKMTDVGTGQVTTGLMGAGDEEWEGFQGATFPSLYSLMAKRHMHEFGTTREQLAMVSVKNHKHGSLNPKAQYKREISVEDVLNSSPVAPPLNLLDCSPISDGAASIILCKEEIAKKFTDTPVYLIASGQGNDSLSLAARDSLTSIKAASVAASSAFKQAKITAKEVGLAEVHDCFSIAELIAMEDLGLCKKGEAGKCVERSETYFDSKMPVNTSGGLKAVGHPVGATGVKQAIEIVQQLRNEAQKRQVKKAEIGLTHNVGGTGGTVVVNIFRR